MLSLAPQILLNGLLTGLIYVLMALGFTLIFGIMRVVNFAHGEIYMFGAYLFLIFAGQFQLHFIVALLLAGGFSALFGVVLERLFFRRVLGNEVNGMILALAVAICLQALALIIFGPDELAAPRVLKGAYNLGVAVVPLDRLFVGAATLVLLGSFYLFLNKTRLGLSMRAVAQDPEVAALHGINPSGIHAAAFAVGCMLAGAAGALMAPVYTIFPYMGELPMLKAFIVVILGGLGSLPGAVIGGLLLGIIESAFATAMGTTAAALLAFVLVVLILAVRPKGLVGGRA